MVPRLDLEGRGMIPEIEIRYEDFGAQAIDAAEKYIDLDLLAKLASRQRMMRLITRVYGKIQKFPNQL